MEKLRISYSLLNLWRRGRYEDAINLYLHLETPSSRAMDEGIEWHKKVQESVEASKRLPNEFLGLTLTNPTCEFEAKVPYNDICELKGYFDVLDSPTLYEIKTGSSKDSGDYTQDFQISMYLLMADMLKLNVDRAMIIHYDQYKKTTDSSLVWKSAQELKRARNFIDTLAPEIHLYFLEHGIFDKKKDLEYNR